MATALLAATASFCSQQELQAHVDSCSALGEDVTSLLSVRSVLDDPTVRWVPFCVLDDEAVERLLTATALMLTAQSFGVMDCMRVAYVVRACHSRDKDRDRDRDNGQGGGRVWTSLRSLFVQGTRMGPRGFGILMSLGLGHLHTLSLSGLGLLPSVGAELGKLLANALPNTTHTATTVLSKLYIESEPKFGTRGVIALCKYLQYNTTLRVVSLRDNRLKRDCVQAIAAYLSLSTALEVLHLSDNPLRLADCRVLLRSVANKGLKGSFRGLYLKGMDFSQPVLVSLYEEGLALGVSVVTPIGFREELQGELRLRDVKGEDAEETKQRGVQRAIEERLRLHQLDLNDKNVAFKECVF